MTTQSVPCSLADFIILAENVYATWFLSSRNVKSLLWVIMHYVLWHYIKQKDRKP